MMRIPNPRERTGDANRYRQVRDDPHYQDCVVIVLVVDEDEGHPEKKPCETRGCTPRMDTTDVLQY